MEWQPIETAPANRPVRVGKWEFYRETPEWKENEGVAVRTTFFGLLKRLEYVGREYHYWKELPTPKSSEATQSEAEQP